MKALQFELESGDYTHRGVLIMNPANSNEPAAYYERDHIREHMADALNELQNILDAYEYDIEHAGDDEDDDDRRGLAYWLEDNYMDTRGLITDAQGNACGATIASALGGPNVLITFDACNGITITSTWAVDTVIVILRNERARDISDTLGEYVRALNERNR